LWVHPGADGKFSLYEDDGKTFEFREQWFMRLNIAWNDKRRTLSLHPADGSKLMTAMTRKRKLVVRVAGETTTREMELGLRPFEVKF
jgi:alpha-D-xyloside xylohydrolase